MKKFFKTLFTLTAAAAAVGGAYVLVKKYMQDSFSDYNDLDDTFDTEFDDDFDLDDFPSHEVEDESSYVTLDMHAEADEDEVGEVTTITPDTQESGAAD